MNYENDIKNENFLKSLHKFNNSFQRQLKQKNKDDETTVFKEEEKEDPLMVKLDQEILELEKNQQKEIIPNHLFKFHPLELTEDKKVAKTTNSKGLGSKRITTKKKIEIEVTPDLMDQFEDILAVLNGNINQFFPYHKVFTIKNQINGRYLLTRNGQELGWFTINRLKNFFLSRKKCYTSGLPKEIHESCDITDVQFTQNYMYPTLIQNGLDVQQFLSCVASDGFAFTFVNYCIQAIHKGLFLLKPYLFSRSNDQVEQLLLQKIYDFSTMLFNKEEYLPRIIALSIFLYSHDVVYL
jgi:hypothetical protein